jgi:rhombotail lipoprotein
VPLRVGIAFVPSGSASGRHYGSSEADLSEMQKTNLLQRVAAEFRSRDYIESIEIVPTTYLRPAGGFENLEQVRRMLNFDVVALVAYDQVQFTSENFFSVAYWTVVGAYVFKGNRNDSHTLMEAVVYDIPSRHLLFRAPGASQVKASTTLVDMRQRLRDDSARGFEEATNDLITNLKTQLEDFRTRVRQAPGTVARIEHKPGYKGGGALDGGFVALLALLAGAGWLARRR